MRPEDVYDVAVVGAGLAGSTAATLYARAGLRVALVERQTRLDAYKAACTHFLQPGAVPVLERLSIVESLEAAGAVRNGIAVWTRWGWIRPTPGGPYGYSIRRSRLDPLLRRLAATTPGVELLAGTAVEGLTRTSAGVSGLRVSTPGGARAIAARLVVGADGRRSRVAALAALPTRVGSNVRLLRWAYYRGLRMPADGLGRLWFHGDRVAYAYPNDDGVTVVAACVPRDVAGADARGGDASLRAELAALPEAPALDSGRRISPVMVQRDLPNLSRRPSAPGLALIGDAALASDPLWAVGCGWALESAACLVDTTAAALLGDGSLDAALLRYRRAHRARFAAHHWVNASYSTGRGFLPHERLLLAAAAIDRATAAAVISFGERVIPVARLLSPKVLGRAARVLLRSRIAARCRDVSLDDGLGSPSCPG